MTCKQCSKCLKTKPLSGFYRASKAKDGHQSRCKECANIYHKKYQEKNKDRIKELNRERPRPPMKKAALEYINSVKYSHIKRKAYVEYHKRNPSIRWAYNQLSYAVKMGRITKPEECSKCGSDDRIQAHYNNYAEPSDVTWLCLDCHVKLRRKLHREKWLGEAATN